MSVGWKLTQNCRAALLERHPPRYGAAVADHVTFKPAPGGSEDTPPPRASTARIVGRADDGAGVEAMVVELDGSTDRPDGSTWHVTWSLAPGRSARESNDVIAARGWTACVPEALELEPARW
jgi:hypothetical protein